MLSAEFQKKNWTLHFCKYLTRRHLYEGFVLVNEIFSDLYIVSINLDE